MMALPALIDGEGAILFESLAIIEYLDETASQAAGAKFFSVDTAPFLNFTRIANSLSTIDAFARAHPLKQPGAPAS